MVHPELVCKEQSACSMSLHRFRAEAVNEFVLVDKYVSSDPRLLKRSFRSCSSLNGPSKRSNTERVERGFFGFTRTVGILLVGRVAGIMISPTPLITASLPWKHAGTSAPNVNASFLISARFFLMPQY